MSGVRLDMSSHGGSLGLVGRVEILRFTSIGVYLIGSRRGIVGCEVESGWRCSRCMEWDWRKALVVDMQTE